MEGRGEDWNITAGINVNWVLSILYYFNSSPLLPKIWRFPLGLHINSDPRPLPYPPLCRWKATVGILLSGIPRVQNRKEGKPNCKGNTISRQSSHRSIGFFKLCWARHKIKMWITEHLLHVTQTEACGLFYKVIWHRDLAVLSRGANVVADL